jgi:hypothetical protein
MRLQVVSENSASWCVVINETGAGTEDNATGSQHSDAAYLVTWRERAACQRARFRRKRSGWPMAVAISSGVV